MAFDKLVASITLSGSILSFVATTLVLISYICYRNEQRSFRHALVFNLALAEWVNSLNNTSSGIIYLRDHALYPGTACVFNGFVGQWSVQAADFSILLIALVTVLTITRTTYLPQASTTRKTLICMSVWVVPTITATTATVLRQMVPVSGNWCWISSQRPDLRYSLTHGWRIAIIFITVGIYAYVWWYMSRHFRSMVSTGVTGAQYDLKTAEYKKKGFREVKDDTDATETCPSTVSKARISKVVDEHELSTLEAAYFRSEESNGMNGYNAIDNDLDDDNDARNPGVRHPREARVLGEPLTPQSGGTSATMTTTTAYLPTGAAGPGAGFDATETAGSEFPHRRQTRQMEREIKRMLLLNAYPVMYVILWIPGLVNRFLEATGNDTARSSRPWAALQASSQFVGLANALTYGFNRHMRAKFKSWWRQRRKGGGRRR